MWLIKTCHGARECCILRLWGRGDYIRKHGRVPCTSSETEWEMYSEKWIMLSHWCQQLLYEVLVQCQYRPWLLTAGEYIWPTTNDEDEMTDDWLDDCYYEGYVPSTRVRDCGGNVRNRWGLYSKICPVPSTSSETVGEIYSEKWIILNHRCQQTD